MQHAGLLHNAKNRLRERSSHVCEIRSHARAHVRMHASIEKIDKKRTPLLDGRAKMHSRKDTHVDQFRKNFL